MDLIRNLPTQQPQQLTQLIQIHPGRVVSMAMSRQEHCQMTLLAFGDGESISEECYFGATLYYIWRGRFLSLWGRSAAVFKRAIAWQFPPIPPTQ